MPNRLADEISPYLLQHSTNPVDWYPWGEEALNAAKARDVPILLSIGYSACHWCHVMEKESFENPEIAEAMNAGFVNIKVDREERPDLDSIYMKAVQTMTGQGGWPLTAFLTPEPTSHRNLVTACLLLHRFWKRFTQRTLRKRMQYCKTLWKCKSS